MRMPPRSNKQQRRATAPLAERDREQHRQRATASLSRAKKEARATRKIERAGR